MLKKFVFLVVLSSLLLVMVFGCGNAPNPFAGNWYGKADTNEILNLNISTDGIIAGTITKGVLSDTKSTSITGNVNNIGGVFLTYEFSGESKVELTGLLVKYEQLLRLECGDFKVVLGKVE